MSMVCIGYENGDKRYPMYMDTDDLNQAEYYYYRKAERIGEPLTAKAILRGKITAEMIESNRKYKHLKD